MKKLQHVIFHQRRTQRVLPHLSDLLLGAHTRQLFRSLLCCIVLSSMGCITVDDPKMNHELDQSAVGSNDGGPTDPEGQADVNQSEVEPTDATSSDSDLTDRDPMASGLADMDDSGRVDAGNTNPHAIDPTECNPAEVFERNGCQDCHGASALGGLDLRGPNLDRLLVDAPAQAEGCQTRTLLDVDHPEHSLILQVIGATEPPAGDDDSCQLVMPPLPDGLIPEADRTCLTQWVHEVAEDYRGGPIETPEPMVSTLRSSLQKVKTLLRGDALTAAEYNQVVTASDEDVAIRTVVESWTTGPAFDRKMMGFLSVALQQAIQNFETEQFDRLRVNNVTRDRIQKILAESFVRTALDLIHTEQPFNQVARTQTWMMTTANLILLQYGDQSQQERSREHRVFSDENRVPIRLQQQIAQRKWFLNRPEMGTCTLEQTDVLNFLFGVVRSRHCQDHQIPNNNLRFNLDESVLTEADFQDWRLVTLEFAPNARAGDRIPFYDVRRLRTATSVQTRLPRVGFFSTNAFFENWMTNTDNQFRVAVNQSLLGGLHTRFSATEPTEPLRTDGVDGEHAENQDCMGCHRQIDPMRGYFAKSYNINYQRPFGDGADTQILDGVRPVFTFYGERNQGGDLRRFGRLIAEHPKFASAWVQKLCLFANSDRCDENDPIFRGISNRFRNGGFNFKSMLVELFSSSLVTGRSENSVALNISITRRDHLCALLAERTGNVNICNIRRVRSIIGLIPKDAISRGAADPSMPSRPNPVYLATAESVCEAVARTVVVNGRTAQFSGATPNRTIERIVNQLMALESDPNRSDEVQAVLRTHFDEARAANVSQLESLRSVFSIACVSPDVTGMGL